MFVMRKTFAACDHQLASCRLLLTVNQKTLGQLRSAAGEGGEIYKRILECREMAASVRRITTPGSDQSSLLDHLAYMDGWLLHLANALPLTGYIRQMLQAVLKEEVAELYDGGHWLAMVMEQQTQLRERMRIAGVEA
jgi:hypothetical protein